MSCQETQQSLSLYVDDQLALPARAACEEHLRECPVCRFELEEMRSLSRSLASLSRPVTPPNLASSISYLLSIEAVARERQPALPLSVRLSRWLKPRIMPYTVGSFASVLLFTMMFSALRPHLRALADAALAANEDKAAYQVIYLQASGPSLNDTVRAELYAAERAPYNDESPSLNPRGALAELTHTHTRGNAGDDDMIVVTDVFSDGRASLASVVQPPRDPQMLDDFQNALLKNAAFVPASYDRRPEAMRVVFVVQKVDVPEKRF